MFHSKQCVFLGYSAQHKGVKCLDIPTGRVYISRDIVFDETKFPFADLHPNAGALLRKEILLLPQHLVGDCEENNCTEHMLTKNSHAFLELRDDAKKILKKMVVATMKMVVAAMEMVQKQPKLGVISCIGIQGAYLPRDHLRVRSIRTICNLPWDSCCPPLGTLPAMATRGPAIDVKTNRSPCRGSRAVDLGYMVT